MSGQRYTIGQYYTVFFFILLLVIGNFLWYIEVITLGIIALFVIYAFLFKIKVMLRYRYFYLDEKKRALDMLPDPTEQYKMDSEILNEYANALEKCYPNSPKELFDKLRNKQFYGHDGFRDLVYYIKHPEQYINRKPQPTFGI